MTEGEPGANDLLEVLWGRLGPMSTEASAVPRRLEALRILRTRRSARSKIPEELDPEVAALFGLIAVEPAELAGLTPEIAEFLANGAAAPIARLAMPAVFQAYIRAVGRIVAAEARLIENLIADVEPAERASALDDAVSTLLPLTTRGFDLLHRMFLLETLVESVAEIDVDHAEDDPIGVSMVDLVGSTKYLKASTAVDLERLVDALFEAGQTATAHRAVHVVKYVGDGLFLSGRDVTELADVTLAVMARLQDTLPLRARAGLAWGPVTHRAGDVFGLPVNVAHIATKAAQPGVLLATAEAAARLDPSRRGRYRTVTMSHPALGATRVATVRPATAG